MLNVIKIKKYKHTFNVIHIKLKPFFTRYKYNEEILIQMNLYNL